MEVALLKSMIDDRDRRIAAIKRKMEDSYHKYAQMEAEVQMMRQARIKSSNKNQTEIEALTIQRHETEMRLNRMLHDLKKQQGAALHTYANVIKEQQGGSGGGSGGGGDSSLLTPPNFPFRGFFGSGSRGQQSGEGSAGGSGQTDMAMVMRMQAQLCKVMHSMGIIDHQMTLLHETCESLMTLMKQILSENTDEKCQLELKLMNELMMADGELRDEKEEFKKKQDKMREQIKELEKKHGKHHGFSSHHDRDYDSDETSSSEEETDSEEEDEEDSDYENEEDAEEKQVLRGALKERRTEISEMEKEIEKQKDMIRAVKVRLSLREIEESTNNEGSGDDDLEETSSEGDETEPEPEPEDEDEDEDEDETTDQELSTNPAEDELIPSMKLAAVKETDYDEEVGS